MHFRISFAQTGSFGHLEVDWVAREGQRGRLVSQPLSPPSSSSPWVHFSVQGAPPTARQMVPFRWGIWLGIRCAGHVDGQRCRTGIGGCGEHGHGQNHVLSSDAPAASSNGVTHQRSGQVETHTKVSTLPCSAHVVIHSKASHPVGPFRLQMPAAAAATPSRDLERAIVSVGPLAHSVPVLEPGGSHKVRVELVGLLPGTQKVTGMMLYDGSKWVATAGAVEVAIDAG